MRYCDLVFDRRVLKSNFEFDDSERLNRVWSKKQKRSLWFVLAGIKPFTDGAPVEYRVGQITMCECDYCRFLIISQRWTSTLHLRRSYNVWEREKILTMSVKQERCLRFHWRKQDASYFKAEKMLPISVWRCIKCLTDEKTVKNRLSVWVTARSQYDNIKVDYAQRTGLTMNQFLGFDLKYNRST